MKKAKGKKINGKATRDLVLTALFTALVAIGAFIRIPAPIVPITLQFAFCLLAGLLLGAVRGGLAVTIYIVMGLIGIPVFTEGGGIFYVIKPSFGYLIGMAIGTFTCGFIARSGKKLSYTRMVAGALAAMLIVDGLGVLYMYLMYNYYLGTAMTFLKALYAGVAVFLPTDIMWCFLMSLIAYKLLPVLEKSGLGERKKKDAPLPAEASATELVDEGVSSEIVHPAAVEEPDKNKGVG